MTCVCKGHLISSGWCSCGGWYKCDNCGYEGLDVYDDEDVVRCDEESEYSCPHCDEEKEEQPQSNIGTSVYGR